jgi:excisionase family DNA binding protein
MSNCHPAGAAAPPGKTPADDDLTRLVRLIARQAAQEAFKIFRDEFKASFAQAGPPVDLQDKMDAAPDGFAKAVPSRGGAERFLSVIEVAVKLGVSSKTVRRMINRGELPVHRVGKLLRVGEHALCARLAEGSRGKRQSK